jgi:hypothetical protein
LATKAPPGTVTYDKDGYRPIENPRHGQDGWKYGEKVFYSAISGDWLGLAEYKEQKKRYHVPDPRIEQRNVPAPFVPTPPRRPAHFFRK